MKPLLLIPALLLAACASQAPQRRMPIQASLPSRPVKAAALRTPEQLREYRFGRYADPGDPLTMHEGHPVYRVETSAGWDLRPGGTAAPASRLRAETSSISTSDAVVAEVNKQRAATRAFTAQTATLNDQLAAMQRATRQVDDLAKQNLALQSELKTLRSRMDAQEAQPRERKSAAPGQAPTPGEDKW